MEDVDCENTFMISKTYYVQKDFSVSDPFEFLTDEREDIYNQEHFERGDK